MPSKKRIADVDRSIEELMASIVTMRAKGANQISIDPLLAHLARLKTERIRLMDHQRLVSD